MKIRKGEIGTAFPHVTTPPSLPYPHPHVLEYSREPAHTREWLWINPCLLQKSPSLGSGAVFHRDGTGSWIMLGAVCYFAAQLLGLCQGCRNEGRCCVLVSPRAAVCAQALGSGPWIAQISLLSKAPFPRLSPPPHCGLPRAMDQV